MVQVQLLGAVAAFDASGAPVDVGPAKCQAVLAALALSPGSVVSVPRLVTMVWGDEPPRTAEKTLQTYVMRLRKGLGDDAITRTGAAYRLEIDPGDVDVGRFEQALDRGDVDGALAEWRGPPLAGLDADGLAAASQGLTERWLDAVERQLAHRIEADPGAAVAPLTDLTAQHPFREGLWALLMTALYRAGRQADALAAYRRARDHLVDQLGVEPGPDLRALEARILAQDEGLRAPTTADGPTGTMTFAVADVDDAMRSWTSHPHETAAAMARYDQIVRTQAAEHDGDVLSGRSGSLGIAFPRADAAVAWAAAVQDAVRREPWPRNAELRIRIGLHAGAAGEQAGTDLGAAVNVATCLAGVGHGGQVLLSAAAVALLDGSPDLVDLGTHRVPGVPDALRLFQLGRDDHPPVRSAEDRRAGNLPRRSRRLIGRDADLHAVCTALAGAPIVTLVGPGGIGKTRLASAAAQVVEPDFDGGGWLVELASVEGGDGVVRAVADTLGVREGPGRELRDAVLDALRHRTALVVIDNCEHVLDGAAALVASVVEECPGVRVLATSRERLGLEHEQVVAVGPLDVAGAAADLFRERARALDQTFDPHGTRADVEEICRRLDGVPLAIELAAARVRTMPPAELLARLDDALRLLAGAGRTGPEHHRTMRLAIEWSYELLSPAEQVVFQRLSTFVGHFDLRAAENVAADGELDALAIDDIVGRLVDQSLVLVELGPFGQRFRVLESIRQFGAEHLKAGGDAVAFADRHARWCVEQVTVIHDQLAGHEELEGVARLAELWPNLRAAVDRAIRHGDGHLAQSLIAPVADEALVRSQTEIAEWAERLLEVAPADDTDLVVFALSLAARRYWRLQDRDGWERLVARHGAPDHPAVHHAQALVHQDVEGLLRWCPEVVEHLRSGGDEHLAQLSRIGVARSLLVLGRFAETEELLTMLAERYRQHGPPSLHSWMLTMLGYSATAQGDDERADRLFEESATIAVPDRTHSRNRPMEALSLARRGEHTAALRVLRTDADDLLENDDIYDMSGTVIAFMSVLAQLDQPAPASRARGHLEAAGQLDTALMHSVVAAALDRLARAPGDLEEERAAGRAMDGRQTLQFIRDVLDERLGGRR